jgi:hypothetical protein
MLPDGSSDAYILKWSLRAGAVYFGCAALAHTIGFKIPGLFIYFDVPSHPYQDQLIGLLAFGWAAFFYAASFDPVGHSLPVKAILIASTVALLGIVRINAATDFDALSPATSVSAFWVQAAILGGYLVWLIVFYRRSRV